MRMQCVRNAVAMRKEGKERKKRKKIKKNSKTKKRFVRFKKRFFKRILR